jgi:hypothetical protein
MRAIALANALRGYFRAQMQTGQMAHPNASRRMWSLVLTSVRAG